MRDAVLRFSLLSNLPFHFLTDERMQHCMLCNLTYAGNMTQVALGRGALDPLAVLAALCGPGNEVLALNLHPLQPLLPPADLAAAVERIVITAVAQVRLEPGLTLYDGQPSHALIVLCQCCDNHDQVTTGC